MSTPLPPLVEPAAELTREEVARYSRHLIIPDLGLDGQKRLKNARVLVIGAGGLGSPALLYLAAAGVGTLGIAEFDEVDESNLQRQIIHGQSDVGKSKAVSAKESLAETNPLVNVVVHDERLDTDSARSSTGNPTSAGQRPRVRVTPSARSTRLWTCGCTRSGWSPKTPSNCSSPTT